MRELGEGVHGKVPESEHRRCAVDRRQKVIGGVEDRQRGERRDEALVSEILIFEIFRTTQSVGGASVSRMRSPILTVSTQSVTWSRCFLWGTVREICICDLGLDQSLNSRG
jgi:hypothetical protein